jgi:hypothetical protein
MPTLRLRPDLESALRQIQGVRAASVVTSGTGQPTEIHVLAAQGKAPKQIVRDVQSLAMARFDLDIDHRIVSVVQLDEADLAPQPAGPPNNLSSATDRHDMLREGPFDTDAAFGNEDEAELDEIDLREPAPVGLSVVPDSGRGRHASSPASSGASSTPSVTSMSAAAPLRERTQATARVMVLPEAVRAESAAEDDPGPRPSISSIMVRTSGDEAEATVALVAQGLVFEGQAVGPASSTHRARLVAGATLTALADLLGQTTELESVTLVGTGNQVVALSVLTVQTPRIGEQIVTGSALVRGDEADAVARSVLDALNRRLSG